MPQPASRPRSHLCPHLRSVTSAPFTSPPLQPNRSVTSPVGPRSRPRSVPGHVPGRSPVASPVTSPVGPSHVPGRSRSRPRSRRGTGNDRWRTARSAPVENGQKRACGKWSKTGSWKMVKNGLLWKMVKNGLLWKMVKNGGGGGRNGAGRAALWRVGRGVDACRAGPFQRLWPWKNRPFNDSTVSFITHTGPFHGQRRSKTGNGRV